MSFFFVSIQGSYAPVQIALFDHDTCLEVITKDDTKASSHLIPYIDQLLTTHRVAREDLSFIAVDKGPGAFTSLRVTIATVNGIAFSHKIPLIGISGLDALAYEIYSRNQQLPVTHIAILLNAYNNDVYFGLYEIDHEQIELIPHQEGCDNISLVLQELQERLADHTILFAGNGVALHQERIQERFGTSAHFDTSHQATSSAHGVGIIAYHHWQTGGEKTYIIQPHYLKTQAFAIKK